MLNTEKKLLFSVIEENPSQTDCWYNNLCPIIVHRYSHNSTCTLSHVDFDGLSFVGLEPSKHIPSGTYKLLLTYSPSFSDKLPYSKFPNKYVPLVDGVPNYTGIRLHVGNYPSDSKGCLLLGLSSDGVSIMKSAIAYSSFLDRLWRLRKLNPNIFFVIQYINEYE